MSSSRRVYYDINCITVVVLRGRATSIGKGREDFERRKTTVATGGIKNSFAMDLHQQGTSVSGDHLMFLIIIPAQLASGVTPQVCY